MTPCPARHPRRYAQHIERKQAERARALGESLSSFAVAQRMNITVLRAEQLAARHGFSYAPSKSDQELAAG